MRVDSHLANADITRDEVLDFSIDEAKRLWREIRQPYGLSGCPTLLAREGNTKVDKNPVPTYTLTLSPARTHGRMNVCERSTPQCRKACVMWTAGRGIFDSVRAARQAKTHFLGRHPRAFLRLLYSDLCRAEHRGLVRHLGAQRWGVRFNVASDIRWERWPWLFTFDGMCAYDYTKWADFERPLAIQGVDNYRLTFSASERWTEARVVDYIEGGLNVAMVFDAPKHQLPEEWNGLQVIDGDVHDFRYDDPHGVIVGLAAKGAATKLKSGGFVHAVEPHSTEEVTVS